MSTFKDAMPVTLSFRKNLRSDGELTVIRIIQNEQEIQLTLAQAQALVNNLRLRIEETKSAEGEG